MAVVIHPLVLFTISEALTREIQTRIGVLVSRKSNGNVSVIASFPLLLSEAFNKDSLDSLIREYSIVYPSCEFYGYYYIANGDDSTVLSQVDELLKLASGPVMRFDKPKFDEGLSEVTFVSILENGAEVDYTVKSFVSEKIAIDTVSRGTRANTKDRDTIGDAKGKSRDLSRAVEALGANVARVLERVREMQSGEREKDAKWLLEVASVLDAVDRARSARADPVQSLQNEINVNLALVLAQVELIERNC